MTITESSGKIESPADFFEEQIDDFGIQAEEIVFDQAHLLHGVSVTVVLPCLDEERAVGICTRSALETMRRAGLNGSVIVVDNGSTDDSARIAIEAGAQVIFEREPGYGSALRAGIDAAQSEFVIMADADGTYELDAIPRLLIPLIKGEADMVLGQRLSDATAETMPWLHRYVGTPAITYLVKKATKSKIAIRDSQSGFRAFRREQIQSLKLSSTGMEFASEMLIRSSWTNMKIEEVDTKYAVRIGESKLSTFSDGLRHLRQILLLSPETAVTIPGMLATVLAFVLWGMAAQSTQGLGQVGSLSWVADIFGIVLSIIGSLVFCTGIVLRYRAESLGLRTDHVKPPLAILIRRFFVVGLLLVFASLLGVAALLIAFHNPGSISTAIASSLSSFVVSAVVVGVVLTAAPVITPFLLTSQRAQLSGVVEAPSVAPLNVRDTEMEGETCRYCLGQATLREA